MTAGHPPDGAPSAAWAVFEADAPDLARRVRARFAANLHHVIGTVRPDGSPRLSGLEIRIADGDVGLGMMSGSAKLADVGRDPRVEVHSAPLEEDLAGGDARLTGVLVEVGRTGDPAGGDATEAGPPGTHFRLELTRATLVRVEGAALVIESWTPDGGTHEARRG